MSGDSVYYSGMYRTSLKWMAEYVITTVVSSVVSPFATVYYVTDDEGTEIALLRSSFYDVAQYRTRIINSLINDIE